MTSPLADFSSEDLLRELGNRKVILTIASSVPYERLSFAQNSASEEFKKDVVKKNLAVCVGQVLEHNLFLYHEEKQSKEVKTSAMLSLVNFAALTPKESLQ